MSKSLIPGHKKPNLTEDGRIAGVIDPTEGQDVATKSYVDLAVANLSWDFYFDNAASGIGSYYKMHPDPTGDSAETLTTPSPLSGSGQAVFEWISDEVVHFETIEAGVIDVHIHAKRATGNKSIVLYAEIYEYTSAPAELLIATTEVSAPLTDDEVGYDFHYGLPTDYDIASTSKLLIKILANLGTGSATTISLYIEGAYDSHLSVRVPTHTLEALYVRKDKFTQDSGILVGTGADAYQEETGATLRTSIDTYSTSEVDAIEAALDYGLSFEGIVTTAVSATRFKVATLAGKGAGFFIPNAGDPYEIYVVQADAAPPEGLHTPVLAYDTSDGDFTHADFVTGDIEVGDIVLVMHPWLAFVKDIKADTEDLQGNVDTMHDTDLPAVKSVVDTLLTRITAAVATASSLGTHDTDIKALLATIAGYLTTEIADILTLVTSADGKLDVIDGEIATIDSEVGTIDTEVGVIDGYHDVPGEDSGTDTQMRDVIGKKSDTTGGNSLIALIKILTAAVPTVGEIQTEMEQDGASLLDTIRDELANGSDGLTALKTAIDAISGAVSTDWKGSFSFTTGYGTTETDISALFSTNLALTTRRKYSVKLDLTTVETDGNFTELYLAVKEKIDGTTYRAIDRKTVTKANIAANAEPGIIIDIPATSENIQITMQMAVGLAANRTIYYAVVKEHLE